MSYDIDFKVKVEGIDAYASVGDCEANTTWNVREMIVKSTGLEWNNMCDNGLVKDVIPNIKIGLDKLLFSPTEYKRYEDANGWGTVESTIKFFTEILRAWENLKMYEPEIASVAHFFIE